MNRMMSRVVKALLASAAIATCLGASAQDVKERAFKLAEKRLISNTKEKNVVFKAIFVIIGFWHLFGWTVTLIL